MQLLNRGVLCAFVLLAVVFGVSFSCEASSVEVHVRPATCPGAASNCCIQTGSKGEDTNGNPLVDQGDFLVWYFPPASSGDVVQFTPGATTCPYGSTAAACQLNSGTTYTIAESNSIGSTRPTNDTWPYSALTWTTGATLQRCDNVLSPTNMGSVHPPGLVMRPPSETADHKGKKKH